MKLRPRPLVVRLGAGTWIGMRFTTTPIGLTTRIVPRALAPAGGWLGGLGSRLAGGCTSGVGLTGGAQFLPGSWAFLAAMFAAGFLAAPLVAREWTR